MFLKLSNSLRKLVERKRSNAASEKKYFLQSDLTSQATSEPVKIRHVNNLAIRALLLRFESLGHDCEFGLVQRRYGAEPMGLFRWSLVRHGDLISALKARLEGIGDIEFTDLWFSTDNSETFVVDKRWGLHMHMYKRPREVNKAVLLPKMCERSAYLRNKLLDDLGQAEKTFIFQSPHVEILGLRLLHEALKAYGDIRLLCVKVSDFDLTHAPLNGRPGEVFRIEPNLFVGFLGRRGNTDGKWDIAFDDWVSICCNINNAPNLL